MSEIAAIQFTQDQARTLTGVSGETVRHWRKTIPYLSTKTGKSARFTFADLLGLAVTNELVSSFGVHIGTLATGIDALFRLFAASGPASLHGAIVVITATEASLHDLGTGDEIGRILAKPAFTVPLTPLIAKIQRHMLPAIPVSGQTALPFPPEVVRSRS